MSYSSIYSRRAGQIVSGGGGIGPLVLCATGQSLTREAISAQTTGGPPATAITQLSNRADGWLTWVRSMFPAFVMDVWRDLGTLPENPLDPRIIAGVPANAWLLSDARMYYGYNHGRGGQLIEGAQANVDLLVAMKPKFAVVGIGESQAESDSEPVLRGKLQTLVQTILDGTPARVMLVVPFTRSELTGSGWVIGNPATDAYRAKLVTLSTNLMADYASNPRVIVFDPNPTHTGSNALARPRPFCVRDHAHLTGRGAYYVAKAAIALLQASGVRDRTASLYPNPAAYDAVTNPFGNWCQNPTFTGTGGTANTGTTGTVPDFCQVVRTGAGNGTAVASVVNEGGTNKLQVVFTPGTGLTSFDILLGTANTIGTIERNNPFTVGTWLRSHVYLECSAYDDWRRTAVWFRCTADSFDEFSHDNTPYGASRGLATGETYAPGVSLINGQQTHFPDEAYAIWASPPPHYVSNTGGQIRLRVQVTIGPTAGSPTIKISLPVIRPIPNPKTAYRVT